MTDEEKLESRIDDLVKMGIKRDDAIIVNEAAEKMVSDCFDHIAKECKKLPTPELDRLTRMTAMKLMRVNSRAAMELIGLEALGELIGMIDPNDLMKLFNAKY